jgi:PilZ domain
MTFRARENDRRRGLRFEVIGSLAGSVTIQQHLAVRNLSCGGALVESPTPLPPLSLHTIQLESQEETVLVKARVLRSASSEDNAFSVAMEFVDPEPSSLAQIRQMLARGPDGV